jgi:hypothetical protein
MVEVAFMTALCTVGVGFYGRFLLALCKESRRGWACYLVRLESQSNEIRIIQQRVPETFDATRGVSSPVRAIAPRARVIVDRARSGKEYGRLCRYKKYPRKN